MGAIERLQPRLKRLFGDRGEAARTEACAQWHCLIGRLWGSYKRGDTPAREHTPFSLAVGAETDRMGEPAPGVRSGKHLPGARCLVPGESQRFGPVESVCGEGGYLPSGPSDVDCCVWGHLRANQPGGCGLLTIRAAQLSEGAGAELRAYAVSQPTPTGAALGMRSPSLEFPGFVSIDGDRSFRPRRVVLPIRFRVERVGDTSGNMPLSAFRRRIFAEFTL